MAKIREDLLRRELAKRQKAKVEAESAPKFDLSTYCFDKQLAFISSTARFKSAVCSRRAGKTIACAADLMNTANSLKGDVAYITLNRKSAKRIIWRELLKINKEYNLNGHPDNTELSITMPNGNVIYVSGAKDESEIEKFRGMALRKVYIDECQSFRSYIKDLVEDVIEPALTDYYGSLCLIGTPGPVPAGYFYEMTHSENWTHFKWTMQDNPFIELKSGQKPIDIIHELAKRRGLSINDPSIQREYFGQWIKDSDSLVYKLSEKNLILELPKEELTYIFGIDIGWKDSDAIAVLGYSHNTGEVYLVEECITPKQDITSLIEQIKVLQDKYKPVRMVMDAGALGKKIQEEIRRRHAIPVEAAEKQRKQEFIKLLNDDLATQKLKFLPKTRFEEDSYLLQWNYDDPSRPKVDDSYHTDIGDAVLYAWRECRHYFKHKKEEVTKFGTDKYMMELEEREAQAMEDAKNDNSDFTDVKSFEDIGVDDGFFDA